MTNGNYFDKLCLVVYAIENPIVADSDAINIERVKLDAARRSGLRPQTYNSTVNPPEKLIREGFEFLSRGRLDRDPVSHNRPVFIRSARTRS